MSVCTCNCSCDRCNPDYDYKFCETEEERHERIKASKRKYYHKNSEKRRDYNRKYMNGELPFQQDSQITDLNSTQQLVLKIVIPQQ